MSYFKKILKVKVKNLTNKQKRKYIFCVYKTVINSATSENVRITYK